MPGDVEHPYDPGRRPNPRRSVDPLNEDAARLLMEAFLQEAKPEKAVEVYEATVKALRSDDLDPDPELMKLYYRASMGI